MSISFLGKDWPLDTKTLKATGKQTSPVDLRPLSELHNLQKVTLRKLMRLPLKHKRPSKAFFAALSDEDLVWWDALLEGGTEEEAMQQLLSLDLGPLESCTELRLLDLQGARVFDIDVCRKLPKLETVNLRKTQVTDLSPLASCTKLRVLDLQGTDVTDLRPLANLHELQELNLHASKVEDLSPLAELRDLRLLNLMETPVADVEPLAKIGSLETLYLLDTRVTQAQRDALWRPGLRINN